MIDYDLAIKDVTLYRNRMVCIRDALNEGKTVSVDQRTDLQKNYELIVRPCADAVNMHEPGEKEWHDDFILRFDNPVEWAVKEGSFFSINNAITFLNRLLGRLEHYKTHPGCHTLTRTHDTETALSKVQQVIRMFDTSAKILADRRKGKQRLVIEDEYDVQDILHCILKPQFPDITTEEHSPSIANGEKRIDLIIPSARIVIEIKIVLGKTSTSRIVDQLKVDIESYHSHRACGTLIGFIYNPEIATVDPEKIVKELSGPRTKGDHSFDVVVEVYPR